MSLYEDLGVRPDATPDQIKAAGKRMAKKHHPDAGGDPDVFDRARKALTILSDPAKREHYDRTGEANLSSDPEAQEDQEAAQLVMQGMVGVLQDTGLNPENTDVTVRIRQHIDTHIRGLKQTKAEHEAAKVRTEKFLKRLKVAKEVPDPIGQFLRDQQTHIVKGLAEIERRLRIGEKAKVMAAAYSYATDGPDLQRAFQEAFATMDRQSTGSPLLDALRQNR